MVQVTRVRVRPHAYADSVSLMQVSATLGERPGVDAAAAVMLTDVNRAFLAAAGLLVDESEQAGPTDLVVAVRAVDNVAAEAALAHAEHLLDQRRGSSLEASGEPPARSIRSARRRLGDAANLAIVSVPGPYAAAEAWQALLEGLHVMIFSDNVALEDEIALKRYGGVRGLLVMGPDCGTAIVNGVGIGFANQVRRGRIGLVGASGSGIQEVSVLIHRGGEGVSQALGTGGRDLNEQVGGRTTLQALALLREDPQTEAMVILSKPPAPQVAERVLRAAAETGKPVVACLLGARDLVAPDGVRMASTLAEAAEMALRAVGAGQTGEANARAATPPAFAPGQWAIRGLYCGGTLCEEAEEIVGGLVGNAAFDDRFVDFGDDQYTRGRPHPMIDPSLRNRAVLEAAADPTVAVVLLDLILGHAAHPDPAAGLAAMVEEARQQAHSASRDLAVLVHVVGTDLDPQGLERQESLLHQAGAWLFGSNTAAAQAAAMLVAGR